MKRWALYAGMIIGIAIFGTPSLQSTDIGKLLPVEAVWLAEEDGRVCIITDTGDTGRGVDVPGAVEDLKSAVPGYVFLETADYLILRKGSEELLQQACAFLRPACMVCMAEEMPDMEQAAAFLEVHPSAVTLRQNRVSQQKLPLLRQQNGRLEWGAE